MKKMYRESSKKEGSVVFCGSQGCCPEGELSRSGDLKISDNGMEINFNPEQAEGLRQYLNDNLPQKG